MLAPPKYPTNTGAPALNARTLLVTTVFSLLCAYGVSFLAYRAGLLFGGVHFLFAVVLGTTGAVIVSLVVYNWLSSNRYYVHSACVISAIVGVTLICWHFTRSDVKNFWVDPIPRALIIHGGESYLFSHYLHFTGPPEIISEMIDRNRLEPYQDDEEKPGMPRLNVEYFSAPRGRWRPTSMENPQLLVRFHRTDLQGWLHGIWINTATNEAYGFAAR
jgi:hypothetical protein